MNARQDMIDELGSLLQGERAKKLCCVGGVISMRPLSPPCSPFGWSVLLLGMLLPVPSRSSSPEGDSAFLCCASAEDVGRVH
jgi:hypothetical protein